MDCSHCGKKLIDGQRVYRPEHTGSDAPPVCCSIECAFRSLGIPESTIRKMDPNLCYHCGLAFPTLSDYREIDGYRYCVECADLVRR